MDDAAIVAFQLNPPEPARKHVLAQFRAQTALNAPPFRFD